MVNRPNGRLFSAIFLAMFLPNIASGTVSGQLNIFKVMTQEVIQTAKFKSKQEPENVVFGTPDLGYFATKNFIFRKGNVEVDLIPITFKKKIRFWAVTNSRPVPLGSMRFESPFPKSFRGLSGNLKHGRLSPNFFLLTGALPLSRLQFPHESLNGGEGPFKNSNRFSFIMIMNRFGELIWAYVPFKKGQHLYSYLVAKPIAQGKFGILGGKKDGFYSVVNSKGDVLTELLSKHAPNPFPIHHDFVVSRGGDFLTIGNRTVKIRKNGETENETKTYLSNTILRVGVKEKKAKVVYDFLDIFHPLTEKHWAENKTKERFVDWSSERADHDFVHANSIDFVPGKGFLISLKHLDRLVLVDNKFKKLIWTIGPTTKDTYQTAGEAAFSHQHGATVLKNKNVLIFDNGFRHKRSRVIELKLKGKKAELAWKYEPKPSMYSSNRSFAMRLENRNTLVYFVAPRINGVVNKGAESDYIVEVDPSGKREVGRLQIKFASRSPGYRAVPLKQVWNETYLGKKLPKKF